MGELVHKEVLSKVSNPEEIGTVLFNELMNMLQGDLAMTRYRTEFWLPRLEFWLPRTHLSVARTKLSLHRTEFWSPLNILLGALN